MQRRAERDDTMTLQTTQIDTAVFNETVTTHEYDTGYDDGLYRREPEPPADGRGEADYWLGFRAGSEDAVIFHAC